MRDGRRKRLGLVEGSEGTVGDTYLDRILTDEEAANTRNVVKADPNVNFDAGNYNYVRDLYDYFSSGGDQADTTPPSDGGGGGGGGGGDGGTNVVIPETGGTTPSTGGEDNSMYGGDLDQGGQGDGITNYNYTPEETAEQQQAIDDAIADLGDNYDIYNSNDQEDGITNYNYTPEETAEQQQAIANAINDLGDNYDIYKQPSTFGTSVDVQQGFTQDFSAPGTLADPLEKNDVVSGADVSNPQGLLSKLGLKEFNAGETLVKSVVNMAVGKPIMMVVDILRAILPKMDPRQKALREFYGYDSVGRVPQGQLMAGYSPVSGGFPGISEPNYGLQRSYNKRIGTIENTLRNKYNMTDAEIADVRAGSYEGDVDSVLLQRLVDLDEAKEKEKSILDLYSGDIDERDQTLEDISLQNKIEAEKQIEDQRRELQKINAAAERKQIEDQRRELQKINAAAERDRIAEVTRQNEIRRQAEIDRLAAARAAARRDGGGNGGGGGGSGGNEGGQSGGQNSGSGYNEGNFCFDPSTLIQMADGSTKQIKNIQLGDATKGGEVTGVFQFKASDEIHDYKGVTVAGSHYVKEDGRFIMVKDSPLSIKINKIPVVYSLDTTDRRIFINDIEFADYNGDGVAKNFLSNAGVTIEGFDTEVLRQVEQRLI